MAAIFAFGLFHPPLPSKNLMLLKKKKEMLQCHCNLQIPKEKTECTEYEHKPTYGLLHRGQHKHGALPIQSGERINLIIWMRSSAVRNKLCPMCDRKPTLVPREWGTGDGFTTEVDTVPICAAL